ncbi:MAG: M42 family metallopeptidase [Promethearchaeota archaeon]
MYTKKLDLKFLEKICNAFGPSGHEREVQKMVLEYTKPFADEVLFDKTGSVIFKKGTSGPKIMLAGHVDEIGYLVKKIEKTGYIKISNLGGVFPLNLIGHQILIRPFKNGEKVIGVTSRGSLASKKSDKLPNLNEVYVDIGCASTEEVKALGIRVGDPAVPYATYREFFRTRDTPKADKEGKEKGTQQNQTDDDGNSTEGKTISHLAVAKAFDDRIGVFMMVEVLRRLSEQNIVHPNIVYGVSTTQEEVGCRGAKTAANLIQPGLGFSLDVTICGAVPGAIDIEQKMGEGIAIGAFDSTMIANPLFRKFALELAEEKGIKVQTGFLHRGGTDAGTIHLTGIGAPSLFFGIPSRYVHSHHSMLDLGDVEAAIRLLVELLQVLDEKTVNSFTLLE